MYVRKANRNMWLAVFNSRNFSFIIAEKPGFIEIV
jgi:hypothetical protein